MTLSHLDSDNQPTMIDVGDKSITTRTATAQALIHFPPGVLDQLQQVGESERLAPKGPVAHTAILAGIAAAKRTSELIPLCHVVPLETCKIHIVFETDDRARIECMARATHKTGVEMEALTGVAVAALTIYDMCKALSHEMVIGEIRLLEKTGGKREVRHAH